MHRTVVVDIRLTSVAVLCGIFEGVLHAIDLVPQAVRLIEEVGRVCAHEVEIIRIRRSKILDMHAAVHFFTVGWGSFKLTGDLRITCLPWLINRYQHSTKGSRLPQISCKNLSLPVNLRASP